MRPVDGIAYCSTHDHVWIEGEARCDGTSHDIDCDERPLWWGDARAYTEAIIRATRDELATMRAHDEPTIDATDFDQMVARIIATAERETRVVTHHQISSATRATRTAWRSSVAPVAAGSQWCAMYRETL